MAQHPAPTPSLATAESPGAFVRWANAQGIRGLTVTGRRSLLRRPTVALFCSEYCAADVIVPSYGLVRTLRDRGVATIGRFVTPIERDWIRTLLRGPQALLAGIARAPLPADIPELWRAPITMGRMLCVAPIAVAAFPIEPDLARDRVVAGLAKLVVICYARPGGGTERLAAELIARGQSVLTLPSRDTRNLVALGAEPHVPAGILLRLEEAGVAPAPKRAGHGESNPAREPEAELAIATDR